MNPLHDPIPADGYVTRWQTWDGAHEEAFELTWDNEAWTATGRVGGHDVQYVVRLSPLWQVRQFLLFRDLAEPDLWLGTDGHGRWGEMNGAHRVDLDGGLDIALAVTPFSHAVPIRRLALAVGQDAPTVVLDVDVETLGVVPSAVSYRRVGEQRYEATRADGTVTIDVDEHGIPHTVDGAFRTP